VRSSCRVSVGGYFVGVVGGWVPFVWVGGRVNVGVGVGVGDGLRWGWVGVGITWRKGVGG